MSTHNIGFYEERRKIITYIVIIIKYHQIRTLFLLLSIDSLIYAFVIHIHYTVVSDF